MLNIFSRFFEKQNKTVLRKYFSVVKKINALEESFSKLPNYDLQSKTDEFKTRLSRGESLNSILPEAFATVREASKRVLGQRHFDVQLLGGMVLYNNMIAEMLTGEGKTLVSTLPAYLNSLTEKGVHIITVNDYLAKRDFESMGQIFRFLKVSVGLVTSETTDANKKEAYLCDITYGTNHEFGFDYLRDNMRLTTDSIVQRPFHYVIVDEVDSILIDEARTPLVISGASDDKTEIYKTANSLVKKLSESEDFEKDEKQKNINLTEKGLEKLEKILDESGFIVNGSLFDSNNIQLYHFINQSLRAHHMFQKEVDYIVQKGEVVIIDEFTGRMMEGRRFSDGLHQSLEAKEGLKIKKENQTLASVTYQNYFKLYPHISGMTGTAMTEAEEFMQIYGLKVISIPPNKTVVRKDSNDEVYLTYQEKERAIVSKVKECYERGQPVLIGTVSIDKSERLSRSLKKANVTHNILNAKHHEKEALIISQAGRLSAVTIATNMAGRGTDIQLGGNLEMILQQESFNNMSDEDVYKKTDDIKQQIMKDREKIVSLGGLVVIGTERHESRRIDNQLRGRSGRQGEPGSSAFYLSLEDDLMRIFGSDKLEKTLKRLGFKEGESISHSMISKSIEKAQKKVEQYNFGIRKNLLKFDNVINEQRQIIYDQRRQFMMGEIEVEKLLTSNLEEVSSKLIEEYCMEEEYRSNWKLSNLKADIIRIFNLQLDIDDLLINQSMSLENFQELIVKETQNKVKDKIETLGESQFKEIFKSIVLQLLDYSWKKNLLELDYTRGSINLRAYANKDPFHEYQKESFLLFTSMLDEFKERMVSVISHLDLKINNKKAI